MLHTMSLTLRCPSANIIAFGGVATRNMEVNEQEMAAGSMRYQGWTLISSPWIKDTIKNQCFCCCIFRRNLTKQVTHSGTNPTSSPGHFSLALDPTSKASEKHPGDEVGTNPRSLLPERLVAFAHSHNTGAVSAHPLLIRMAQQSDPKSGAFNCRGELKAPH